MTEARYLYLLGLVDRIQAIYPALAGADKVEPLIELTSQLISVGQVEGERYMGQVVVEVLAGMITPDAEMNMQESTKLAIQAAPVESFNKGIRGTQKLAIEQASALIRRVQTLEQVAPTLMNPPRKPEHELN